MCKVDNKKVYRIIDANFNRAKEGLRVCEDICRFIIDAKKATKEFKIVRHKLTEIIGSFKILKFIDSRDIENDVGKGSMASEFQRKQISDIFYANSQRVKESIRVLEEMLKIINKRHAEQLKGLRYKIYGLEKEIIKKFQVVSDFRCSS